MKGGKRGKERGEAGTYEIRWGKKDKRKRSLKSLKKKERKGIMMLGDRENRKRRQMFFVFLSGGKGIIFAARIFSQTAYKGKEGGQIPLQKKKKGDRTDA